MVGWHHRLCDVMLKEESWKEQESFFLSRQRPNFKLKSQFFVWFEIYSLFITTESNSYLTVLENGTMFLENT